MLAAQFDKSFQFKNFKKWESGKWDGWIWGKDKLFNMKLLTMVLFKQPVASCVHFFVVFGYFGSGNRLEGRGSQTHTPGSEQKLTRTVYFHEGFYKLRVGRN